MRQAQQHATLSLLRPALPLALVLGCAPAAPAAKPAAKPNAVASIEPVTPRFVDVAGARVEAVPFAPGRYANRTDVMVNVTREGKTRESTTARSSFVLAFAADGSVAGCRGQHVDTFLDGTASSHSRRIEEQQGYSGKWSSAGDLWIDVALDLDNTRCKQLRRYTNLEPKPWFLRCLSVVRGGALAIPALACRVTDAMHTEFSETSTHTLAKLLPGEWLALGTGNGVRVSWREEGIGLFTEKDAVITVSAAESPISDSSWEK